MKIWNRERDGEDQARGRLDSGVSSLSLDVERRGQDLSCFSCEECGNLRSDRGCSVTILGDDGGSPNLGDGGGGGGEAELGGV